MLVGKVWFFVVVAVLFATDVSSKQSSGVGGNLSRRQELEQKLSIHSVGTPVYQVSPKQSALDGPNNENEFSGNWTNPIDSKWYSKPSSQIGLHFAGPPQERSEDVSKKMLVKPFSKKLFDIALKLRIPERALDTRFIQGMTDGILHPEEYTGFMVQDIAYLAHVAKMFKEGARMLEEQENFDLALNFLERAERYNEDYQRSLKTWRLESAECVKTGPAAQMYMGYTSKVLKSNPKNLLIATLPCSMLWPWIAVEGIGKARLNERNPYLPWFEENERQPGQQGTTEKLVDKHFALEEEGPFIRIFCEGVMMEVNMFREASRESLLESLDEICRFDKLS